MKMEATCSSKTFGSLRTTTLIKLKDRAIQSHRCQKLKFNKCYLYFWARTQMAILNLLGFIDTTEGVLRILTDKSIHASDMLRSTDVGNIK
jgi:hypothetical protein